MDKHMNWIPLTSEEQLDKIIAKSAVSAQLIFKHSSRCSISSVVKARLERKTAPADIDFYFLDLLSNRDLSNKIARAFSIDHESPQVLLIKNARCIYDESHLSIRMDEIEAQNMAA